MGIKTLKTEPVSVESQHGLKELLVLFGSCPRIKAVILGLATSCSCRNKLSDGNFVGEDFEGLSRVTR